MHERNDGRYDLKDLARTPPELFRKLNDQFSFTIDLATNGPRDSLCERYFSRNVPVNPTGFLNPDLHLDEGEVGYCNPPYGLDEKGKPQIPVWTARCLDESIRSGVTIGMLLPADTSTLAFHRDILGRDEKGEPTEKGGAAEIIWLWPRVVFNNPDGTRMQGSPKFGSMFVVFGGERWSEGMGYPINASMRWK